MSDAMACAIRSSAARWGSAGMSGGRGVVAVHGRMVDRPPDERLRLRKRRVSCRRVLHARDRELDGHPREIADGLVEVGRVSTECERAYERVERVGASGYRSGVRVQVDLVPVGDAAPG